MWQNGECEAGQRQLYDEAAICGVDPRDWAVGVEQQRPQPGADRRRGGKPQPAAQPRQRIAGRDDDREIKDHRPRVWPLRRNKQRRRQRANEAQASQRGSVEHRRSNRRERHNSKRRKSRSCVNEGVEPVSGVDRAEGAGDARRRQHAGDISPINAGDGVERSRRLSPPQEFAGADERSRNDEAEKDARSRAEIALFD